MFQTPADKKDMWAIVNSIGDAVVATDTSGQMTFYNPAAKDLLGVEASKDPSDKWSEHFGVFELDKKTLFAPDQLPLVLALKGKETNNVVQFIRNKNRPNGVFISVTGRAIHDADSKITGAVVVIKDISDLKKAEEEIRVSNAELVAVNRELEAFSYSVSHDLRAPLRSIIGFSDILLNKHAANLNTEGLDYLNRVKDSGDKLGQLIDGLLDLSRLTRGDIKREDINLSEMAKGVLADLQVTSPERKVNFDIAEGIIVNADQRLLRSVLINLIGNAWKFTSKKPDAQITFGVVTTKNDKPTYFVKDNGAGFNEEYSNKLFNIFQRLHSVKEFEGHGIGLATVQRVIHRHGGTVWAEGKLNEGATFYFTL